MATRPRRRKLSVSPGRPSAPACPPPASRFPLVENLPVGRRVVCRSAKFPPLACRAKTLAPDTTEVLITGFATQELAAEAAREGASRLLCKPLIDTPGVGPENHQGLRHLQGLLHAAAPGEVHLVVSASRKRPDTRATV